MPKAKNPSVNYAEMRDKFLERASELWDEQEPEFSRVCNDSEKKRINVSLTANIDLSESKALLKTVIAFTEPHTDHREDTFDNPDYVKKNPPLPGVDMDKARGKKAAAKDE